MLAWEERLDPNSCLNKAGTNEPIFVLRGQVKLAAWTVRQWAEAAEKQGTPVEKVSEAYAIANAMEAWPSQKVPD